jgi:hypothetical protein
MEGPVRCNNQVAVGVEAVPTFRHLLQLGHTAVSGHEGGIIKRKDDNRSVRRKCSQQDPKLRN